jgi:hypothetical protein
MWIRGLSMWMGIRVLEGLSRSRGGWWRKELELLSAGRGGIAGVGAGVAMIWIEDGW